MFLLPISLQKGCYAITALTFAAQVRCVRAAMACAPFGITRFYYDCYYSTTGLIL